MNINWFPGHMKKTRELLKSNLKLIDVVIELLDARIPMSSKNPEIDSILGDTPRVVVLNKSDLSNNRANNMWMQYFNSKGEDVILANSIKNKGIKEIIDLTNKKAFDKLERLKKRGVKNRAVRVMIVGIPNVGKSTLINGLAGKKSAKTGNRPGVTKGKQWIRLKGNIEMLDTPGILWPKFEDKKVALNLAFTGAIKDEILDIETLGLKLIERLLALSPESLINRYNIDVEEKTPLEIYDEIAIKRGCILKGNNIDYTRVSHIILDEFRRGKMGAITLELP
ncbi:ribosome biogenesis GTPase YlqF [Clostridiisalibacter paucivorans]|uniref:ribosome biogenesis GTPase YlqF n=1 Tax=Clostridiisalibacter paucivorans TaxID=408753 RepID=UPI00047A34CA|nr:ribosome biogenesis GTPase YlqF [Clostridiisalibacter paucivorans]